jgi:hypothetical protein
LTVFGFVVIFVLLLIDKKVKPNVLFDVSFERKKCFVRTKQRVSFVQKTCIDRTKHIVSFKQISNDLFHANKSLWTKHFFVRTKQFFFKQNVLFGSKEKKFTCTYTCHPFIVVQIRFVRRFVRTKKCFVRTKQRVNNVCQSLSQFYNFG